METAATRPPILEGPYDLAVVGGGINGVGIARDAVLRGKTVILLEKGDFGEGTSSRSSKMIHGGIRYLEQLRLGLVRESLMERWRLLKLAPHLVRPQSFLLPIYKGAARGPRMVRAGLLLYDLLAAGRRLGKAAMLEPEKLRARLPALLGDGLLGGGIYFDAVMDDARLVLANALGALEEARRLGITAVLRNHAEVVGMEPGSPARLRIRDRARGEDAAVLAHAVVRAVGPWSDPARLAPSKGVHIVVPGLEGLREGILLTHGRDGRVFFLVPWLGRTVIGTTETPFAGSPDAVRPEREDVDYLLEEVQRVLPGLGLRRGDISAAFAGVRPLARRPTLASRLLGSRANGRGLGAVSRVHALVEEPQGIWSVFGGKYTTYRAVAASVLDRLYPGSACETAARALPGAEEGGWDAFRARAADLAGELGEEVLRRLFDRYGSRARAVARRIRDEPGLGAPLAGAPEALRAEVVHAAREELAVFPSDVLERRTALRFRPDGGRAAYDEVEALLLAHAPVRPPRAEIEDARRRYLAALDWDDRLRGG